MTTSPTTDQPELLPVIQADRAFAAQWIVIAPQNARLIRSGEWDHHHGVQAAARHRLTSPTPTLGDMVDRKKLYDHVVEIERFLSLIISNTPLHVRRNNEAGMVKIANNFADVRAYLNAAPASPIPTATEDMGKARLALEAIKAVTATTKDAVAGLSRIMAITRSAGVDAPYSDLMAKPDVAVIVNRPRSEWRHLFERAEACTIPPEGWACSRTPGHDGPCAASSIPTSVNRAGERERIGAAIDSFSAGMLHSEKIDAVVAALSPALDNTAVEGQDRFANDEAAKALYDTWSDMPGWVPWIERGNSDMQERARREVTL